MALVERTTGSARTAGEGRHRGRRLALQETVKAQFGDLFRFVPRMRRTHHELECPPLTKAAETVNPEDASERIEQIHAVVDPGRALVRQLSLFR